jgi:hypothetical protein
MATAGEFVRAGITGQTFREITEKFGKSFNAVAQEDQVMGNYAIAFAWFREKEHLPVPEALFEDEKIPEVAMMADFVSTPPSTTP